VIEKNNVIYFSHPIFTQYQTKAPKWVKQLFLNALDRLLPQPIVRIEAPSATLVMLNEQPQHSRYILHILFYIPERRCEEYDVIEDIIPLFNVPVKLRIEREISAVNLVPQCKSVDYSKSNGVLAFEVPQVYGHCMVELRYEND
jgi:hypothetical protein